MTKTPKKTKKKTSASLPSPWQTSASVRSTLASDAGMKSLWKTFKKDDGAVLLELTHDERVRLLAPEPSGSPPWGFVVTLEGLAYKLATTGRGRDALALFDALLLLDDIDKSTYCNALWAIQDDNTHLGVDEPRARRYLAAALPHGEDNPPIFYNACCVLTEIGDVEGALRELGHAVLHGHDPEAMAEEIWNAPMFAPLRRDGRWVAVLETTKPR